MVVVLDTTGFPRKGIHSAGVERAYSDMLDRVTNCQLGVGSACAGPRDYILWDRERNQWHAWTHAMARQVKLDRTMLERDLTRRCPQPARGLAAGRRRGLYRVWEGCRHGRL